MEQQRFIETGRDSFFGNYLYEQVIPEDHFLRLLKQEVDRGRSTGKLIKLYKGEGVVGRPPFDPALVLKVELIAYLFTPDNGQVLTGWEHYDLHTPIQPVTTIIDRARCLATVKTNDREIVLHDVAMGESPYNLLQQVNLVLAQSCQPFVA